MLQTEDLDERTLQAVSILAAAMNRVGRTNGIVTEAVRTVLSARSSRALAFASRAFNGMEVSLRGRIGEEAEVVAQELRHDLPRFGPRPQPKPKPSPELDPAMFVARLRDPWANSDKPATPAGPSQPVQKPSLQSQSGPITAESIRSRLGLPRPQTSPVMAPASQPPTPQPIDPASIFSGAAPAAESGPAPDVRKRISEQVADLRRLRALLQKDV